MKYVAVCALLVLSFSSSAQVHKCKGADGRTHYSDAPCAANQSGGQVKLQNNTIDTGVDWARNENYTRQVAQDRRNEQLRRMATVNPTGQAVEQRNRMASSHECAVARREATFSSLRSPSEAEVQARVARASASCGDGILLPATGSHSVQGHVRRDGTYVQPHQATNPDGTTLNNWSTRGNVNPYTGQAGTQDPYRR